MSKFIFVTGGVVSGLGKGITAASLGRLLKQVATGPAVLATCGEFLTRGGIGLHSIRIVT